MKNHLMKLAGMGLLVVAVGGRALAVSVPEIDPASGVNAIALLAGAMLVIRSRRKR